MNIRNTSRVLLLANDLASAHAIREAANDASIHFELMQAWSRREFLNRLATYLPNIILADGAALPGISIEEIVSQARRVFPVIPVLVFGTSENDGEFAKTHMPEKGADGYIAISEIEKVPLMIEHVLRMNEDPGPRAPRESQVQRTEDVIRENQKLITMGRLSASIAHEINNPLESITNLLFLLRTEAGLSENAENYLGLAERELARVVHISKQTLNFNRETATPVRVQPSELLEEVLVLYSRQLAEKNLQVVRQYHSADALTVFPGEMRQVFSNLVTNAIEASAPGGKVVLRIRRTRKWSDPNILGLRIVVADTGSGISIEARRRIGELFFTTKGQRGTGLGLWVSRSIVQHYGGSLELYSSTRPSNHGTVFSVFLPTNLRPRAVKPSGTTGSDGSGGSAARALKNGTNGKTSGGSGASPAAETVARNFGTIRGGIRRYS